MTDVTPSKTPRTDALRASILEDVIAKRRPQRDPLFRFDELCMELEADLSAAKARLEREHQLHVQNVTGWRDRALAAEAAASQGRADAIEECAKICDQRAKTMNRLGSDAKMKKTLSHAEIQAERVWEARHIADAIRALKGVADAQGAGK